MRITRICVCVCLCLCNYSLFIQANDCHATAHKKNPEDGTRQRKINPREEEFQRGKGTTECRKAAVRNEGMDRWETNKEVIFVFIAGGKIQSTWSNSI